MREHLERNGPASRGTLIIFARDLQERLGILALLALPAPFRICKLQILLAARETDPVSGHHFIINNLDGAFRKVQEDLQECDATLLQCTN